MSNFYGFPPLLNVVGAQLDDDLLNPGLPSQIRSNFLEPAQQDPRGSRDLQALREVGIDPSFDLEEAKSRFLADQVSTPDFIKNYPTLAASLASKDFVQIARDDMGNIIETEGWWNEIANAYEVSRDTVGTGSMGTRAMLEGRDLYPYERRKIERARQLQRAHMQSQPGWLAAGAELFGTMQETLGYSLAASAATSAVFPPAAPFVAGGVAFATTFNMEAGNLYADLVIDGYTPAQAADIAATYGSAVAAFGAAGLKFAGAPFKELAREVVKKRGSELLRKETAGAITRRILGQYAGGVGAESVSEGFEEVITEAGKRRASELYRPDNLYEPEYLETFGQAFWHTFKGMTVLGGIPTSGRLANQNIRAAQSLHAEREAVRAAENYAKSRAPEAAEQVSREAGETLPDDKYYIRAQGFMETVRDIERQEREAGRPEGEFRKTLEELEPGLLAKLEEAAARDGDVELSKTDFDKVFSKTEAFKAAFQHVAHREDGMTVREREEFMGIREKMTKDMEEEQKAELQKMQEVEDELVEIRQTVRAAVEPVIGEEAAKGMDVAANMTVLTSFITRAAAVQGISPKEFVERYMPEIQQRVLGEEAAEAAPVIEVVEAAPEMSETMTEANEAPVTRVTPVVASAATDNPQRQAVEPEPAAEPEVEATPEVEPEVTEEAAPAPEPAAEPETDEAQLFEGDATPEQIAKFLSLLPPRNAQGLFDLSNEKRLPRTGRFVKMQEALMAMDRGEITREQRDALADILKPVLADDQIYDAPTNEEMSNALKPKQVALLNQNLEAGRRVGVRLDIPSTKKGARTIAVHDVGAKSKKAKGYQRGGKEVSYTNVARLSNAEMVMHQETAKAVALGENKDKLGVIYGDWMPTTVEEATKIAKQALTDPAWRQVGIDPERHGYYYDRKTGEPLVSADEVVQVGSQVFAKNAKVAGKEQFLYSKEGAKKVLGKAGFEGTDSIKKILLDPDAKPTTLMHELMHWNLELMSDMSLNIEQKAEADRTALEKQVLKDTTALLEWAGYEGTLEGWRDMDVDARRPFHEAIAASFELFLYKGEAPSRQLKGIFQRLLNYLNESYKQIVERFQKEYQDEFNRPLPALNDDVRAIFGRMMSAERDTMDFFDQYDMTARLVTREQWVEAGRDEKDYDEYDRDFKDAIAEAQAELTQRRMEEVGWQGRARERTGGKIREERRRTEAKAREDIDADVRETPIFQLQSYIYNGYYRAVDNPKVEPAKAKSTRLSYEAVAAIDEKMAKKLAKRGLLKKEGGIPLDVARNMFGFESNEQMVKELSESRSIKDEVEYRLDRYMIEEQSGLTDPVLVEERIQAAIHNRMRERVIGLELRYILNNGKNTKEELANAREMARDIIGRTPTGDINLTAYNRAAARARRKALKALKDGDMEAAAFAKRQELLNEALIREGGKAREEVRKLVNANKRVFRHRSDKALAKAGYDVVIVKGLRALLSKLGIGGAVQDDPAAAMDAFMRYDPNFAEEFNSEIQHFLNLNLPEAQVGDRRKQMERLTLSDAKRLRTLINQWLKRSKDVRTATLGAKKALVEEHQTELLEQIVKLPAKTRAVGEKESIFGNIRDYFSDLIRFEHLFRRIDGGKDGPWTRVFRMVKDAGNTYRREFLTFMSDMEAALKKLDLKMPGGERTISVRLGQTDVMLGSKNPGAKTDLMHMAMHYYGNASNRERLVAGYAGPNADEATLARTEAEIRTFLQEQIDKGVLTKSDFEWMQGIFDRLSGDDMFGRAQAVMKEVRGYEMTAIQPTPFTIMFPGQAEAIEFAGGYIPIKFEDGSPDVLPELEEGELSPEQQNKRMLSILPSFTKERSNMPAPKPLRLGLQGIAHHAGEVYRYIHMTEPSMHIYRVLNGLDGNSPVRQAFIDRFGQRVYQNMLGWLKRSAYQAFERDSSQVSGLLYTLARNANMGIMFLNVGNALQNYTGLVMPMRQLGSRRVLSALTRTFVGKGIREEIAAKSPEMKARLERQIYDIMQGQRKLMTSEDSVWATAKGWINKNAYILQQITQNQVDVAVWQAAYNKETEVALKQDVSEAEAEKRAIAYADSIVRQTQMAGEKEDLSMFESQGGLFKAFFPFKSWFINWMNSAYAQGRIDASQADRNKITELATTYFYMLLIPALLAQAATDLAAGEDWDDEDDGYSDDLTEFFIVTQLNQAVGGIPVASDTWRFIANNWIDDSYWNSRFPVAPWQSALERLNRSAERALERPGRGTLNFVSELGTMMGVPTSRIFSRATLIGDEIYGELESESTYDFLRGAVTGQRSDLQRLSQ